jgi:hypothetical protein
MKNNTKQAFEKLNISYMDSDFENKFYSLPFDPEKKAVLVGEKLIQKPLYNQQ